MGAGLTKPYNLRKEFVASELHRRGVILDIIGLPEERFKQVRFRFSSVDSEDEEALRTVATYKRSEILCVDVPLQTIAALCSEGVEVLNLCGRCQLRLTSLLSFLNDQNIHLPLEDGALCDVIIDDDSLDGFVMVQQFQRPAPKGESGEYACVDASRSSSLSNNSGCLPTIEEERED